MDLLRCGTSMTRRGDFKRQENREHRTVMPGLLAATNAKLPFMPLFVVVAHPQTEPGSAQPLRREERLEDAHLVLFCDAAPGVRNRNHYPSSTGLPVCS